MGIYKIKDKKGRIKTVRGLMFTGLYDINGVEIWEGDVVEYEGQEGHYYGRKNSKWIRGIVVWKGPYVQQTMQGYSANLPCKFDIEPKDKELAFKYGYHPWSKFYKCKVIK